MRAASFAGVLLLLIVVLSPRPVLAEEEQTAREKKTSSVRPAALGVWGGMSYDSPTDLLLGTTPGRDFHELAFRITWRLVDISRVRIDYTLDFIPVAMLTRNPTVTPNALERLPARTLQLETRYAIGGAPIGLRMGVQPVERLFVFGSGSVGVLFFEGAVPTAGASSFNYTFDFGGGVEIVVTERLSLTGGYKLHHLSNGDLALENPGVDSNLYYVGLNLAE